MDIVKNALNERYRRFHKLSSVLQSELNELKKSGNNTYNNNLANTEDSSSINLSQQERENILSKYQNLQSEINRMREEIEVKEKTMQMIKFKEDQIHSEYESFKCIYLKEIRNLKFDLEETVKQRDTLRDALIEFKNYFLTIK